MGYFFCGFMVGGTIGFLIMGLLAGAPCNCDHYHEREKG
jgi:hypothetical protein